MKRFCVNYKAGRKPWPLLVWFAVSWWGCELTTESDCPNRIVFTDRGWFGATTTDLTDNTTLITINTAIIRSNGLFYNVLLHELGHANGHGHSGPNGSDLEKVMSLSVHVDSFGRVVQNVVYITNNSCLSNFLPASNSLSYTGDFYDFVHKKLPVNGFP